LRFKTRQYFRRKEKKAILYYQPRVFEEELSKGVNVTYVYFRRFWAILAAFASSTYFASRRHFHNCFGENMVPRQGIERLRIERLRIERPGVECCKCDEGSNTARGQMPGVERVEFYNIGPP
jgi:hypothetical protein